MTRPDHLDFDVQRAVHTIRRMHNSAQQRLNLAVTQHPPAPLGGVAPQETHNSVEES